MSYKELAHSLIDQIPESKMYSLPPMYKDHPLGGD